MSSSSTSCSFVLDDDDVDDDDVIRLFLLFKSANIDVDGTLSIKSPVSDAASSSAAAIAAVAAASSTTGIRFLLSSFLDSIEESGELSLFILLIFLSSSISFFSSF